MIGEYPTKAEATTGRPFAARRGRENEIDRFFDGVRLPGREECYFTLWVREWCGEEGEFEESDFARDLPALEAEISMVQPEIIIALGRRVIRYFLGDVDVETTNAIQWKLPADSPARRLFTDPDRVVVCAGYSPAAGFRSPEISSQVAYNFAQIGAFLKGEIAPRKLFDDPIPNPEYTDVTDPTEVDRILDRFTVLAVDTEGWPDDPWSVQITGQNGQSFVLRARQDTELPVPGVDVLPRRKFSRVIQRFVERINREPRRYRFIFQSALHDLTLFRVYGVNVSALQFDDTQIMAYNLQLEPLGLKALAPRHCGMEMQDYTDIMGSVGEDLARDWLEFVNDRETEKHQARCQEEFVRLTTTPYTDKRGAVKAGRKLRAVPKLPKTDLHKSIERCLRSKTSRKLWGDQTEDRHVEARAEYPPMPQATLDYVPRATAIRYSGRDSDATYRLYPELRARIDGAGLADTYAADIGTVPIIDRMQYAGIRPSLPYFAKFSDKLGLELAEIRGRTAEQLMASAGYSLDQGFEFNPNSTYQVGELLYGKFGLPELKRTPGGDPSTNDKILEALEKDPRVEKPVRAIIGTLREYREVYKLKSTFVDQIPDFVRRWPYDGRIHASFRITRVVSGRLAASDPNILALPKHGKFAKEFQRGIVADDGHILGSWDLSQIELRILAHLSQDPVLLAAFRNGLDLHAKLAQRIFGGDEKDYKKGTERLAAKAINFGIPMGMTEIGLCIELKKNGVDVTEDDAKRWLDETMGLYAEVPNYQQYKIAEARKDGFVTDLCGRRRYVGGIRSFDHATRSEAERFAFSTPIQAGAQQVAKKAMYHIWHDIILPRHRDGEYIEPLAWIHDDMRLESDERRTAQLNKEMIWAMTETFKGLSVPIETSGDFGYNWGDMVDTKEMVLC